MNCLPLTVTADSGCRGLPAATNDAVVSTECDGVLKANVKVCRWQPLTELCPLDELFTPHWSPLDELFTPHWSCWKRLYRFAENNLTMRLLTRRKLLMELLMRLLTATAQG